MVNNISLAHRSRVGRGGVHSIIQADAVSRRGLIQVLAFTQTMLATVAKFLDPWEAYVVRARLESEGIPATVAYANHAIMNWPQSLALGGTAVQVPTPFIGRAREILSEYRSGALEDELVEAVGIQREHCPQCGSTNFKRTMQLHKRLWAILIVLVVAAFPAKRSTFICRECGYRWQWGEGEG